MTKRSKSDRDEAIARLREWIKPGDTVYTVLDHVSRSGMMRHIRVVVPTVRFCCGTCGQDAAKDTARGEVVSKQLGDPCWREDCHGRIVTQVDHIHPNYAVGKALGLSHAKRNGREQDALLVGGCGMDMGFHLVYELSATLYGSLRCEACHKYPSGEYRTVIDAEFKASYNNQYPSCEYCGAALVGGYPCLGKGKCPSNYHNNHRDTIQCEGTIVYNPDGPNSGERCYWSSEAGRWVIDISEAEAAAILADARAYAPVREDGHDRNLTRVHEVDAKAGIGKAGIAVAHDLARLGVKSCPTCAGKGRLPNPEGPERWDLLHTDGYAIRHKWL